MQCNFWSKITLFCLPGIFSLATHASDTAKEKRWADQIVDAIMVGDAEWLTVGKQKVLALYTEQEAEKPKGGVIVIHGQPCRFKCRFCLMKPKKTNTCHCLVRSHLA